jgi:hypothetical protein
MTMRLFWKLAAGLMALVILTVSQTNCVFACSCLPPGPPEEALSNATAVFSGTVTTMDGAVDAGAEAPIRVTFAVSEIWKGPEQAMIVATTSGSSASCGFGFVQGQEYLVYASTVDDSLQVSLCSRTTQLAMAGEDLAALGEGTTPPAPVPGTEQPTTLPATGARISTAGLAIAAVGATLMVVAIGATIIARRRSA